MLRKCVAVLVAIIVLVQIALTPVILSAEKVTEDKYQLDLLGQLKQVIDDDFRLSTHNLTGNVRFIGTKPDKPIFQSDNLSTGIGSEAASRTFLSEYGSLFGIKDQLKDLQLMKKQTIDSNRSSVRFQQVYNNVPILGAELISQVDRQGNVICVSGEILPDISISISPEITAAKAQENAITVVEKKYGINSNILNASSPELWIYNPIIFGMNNDITRLVWRVEVIETQSMIEELVLVDAKLGNIALNFNQIPNAKYRQIYDNQNNTSFGLPGNGPVRSEGNSPTGITEVDKAYDYIGDSYDFYSTYHSRDSLDDAGMPIVATVRYCESGYPCPLNNAFWDPSLKQLIFGDGFATADDVIAHEFTHGVTQHESNLLYWAQSGAINEAFSDIWGEFIDQTNSAGNDDPSVRWLIGEDLPGGAGRSMSNPPAYSQPDKMTSSYYECTYADDNYGVHTNSGVANKAAYLLTDGGSFNGITVTGIGMAKTADLFYEVQANLFTTGSDYADLYDALQQAAVNLGYSSTEQQAVKNAVDATEMNMSPPCGFTEAPVCDSGVANTLFFDDMENAASGNWAFGGDSQWAYDDTFEYTTSGEKCLYGNDPSYVIDSWAAMTADIALSIGSQPYLRFEHAYILDPGYDGGVIEYSIDGGSNWVDAGSLIEDNGYTHTLSTSYGNPLGGQSAYSGVSPFGGTYISTRVDLISLVGQNVRFRFRIGTDNTQAGYGWWIDDVHIYTCGDTPPTPTPTPAPTGTTVTFYTNTSNSVDGHVIYGSNSDWATVHDAANATQTTDFPPTMNITIGVTIDGRWNLSRGIFGFDTSGLPVDCTITSATLNLHGAIDENDDWGGATWNLYQTSISNNSSLSLSDYDKYNFSSSEFLDTDITISSWNNGGLNSLTLNSAGLNSISKGGYTTFGMRMGWDVDDTPPSYTNSNYSRIQMYTAEQGSNYIPALTVTYTTPAINSLVAHWPLDGDADDSVGDNHGTISGAPTWITGVSEDALEFDGDNDYVNVGNSPSLNPTDKITVEAWIKWDGLAGDERHCIVAKSYNNNLRQYGLYMRSNGNIGWEIGEGANYYRAETTSALSVDIWHHIVGTFDADTDTMILYIDGVENNSKNDVPSGYTMSDNGHSLYIGARRGAIFHFNGAIDEVRIYNTALSAQKVLDLYNELAPIPVPSLTVQRNLPSYANAGATFDVTLTFTAPEDGFGPIGLTDGESDSNMDITVNTTWCTPNASLANTNDNTAEYIWYGPYSKDTFITAVYQVTVDPSTPEGTYSFNGDVEYYIDSAGPYYESISGDSEIQIPAPYTITGLTNEVDCSTLPFTSIQLYEGAVLVASTTSNDLGGYSFIVPGTGSYDVVANKSGYKDATQSITIADPGEYSLNFNSETGLVPEAPNMSYVLLCVNHWQYPVPPCDLSMSKVLQVVNAWLNPVLSIP